MKIAVARVKDVRNAKTILRADSIGRRQDFRQARARHYCILQHRIGRDSTHSAERPFARSPKTLTLLVIARASNALRAMLTANATRAFCFFIKPGFESIKFDEQSRL